jgi:hypothetical protein
LQDALRGLATVYPVIETSRKNAVLAVTVLAITDQAISVQVELKE